MNGNTEENKSNVRRCPSIPPEEEIVISGIAGRFPDSDNVELLAENLYNKKDLISDDDRRWKLDHPEIPQKTGKVRDLTKFDALFFAVHFKQAHTLDPMSRMLMEHAYEAIVDAGVNPTSLRGTNTGVFVGSCYSESEKTWFYERLHVNGFGLTGCSRAMLANRISYWLGVHGPSYTLDTACSSSLYAMEHAYKAIRDGLCDAAIVGGSNLCLHPYVSLQFSRLGVLSPDGQCRSFDDGANGYVRSETVAVAFLQKAKDAKRIYATIVHAKTNSDGFKEQGITFPSSRIQCKLFTECYDECGVDVKEVDYLEAHATGTIVGDPEELNAIDEVFCKDRTTPLKIGSVKSNMGHTEPASGMCSVTKIIVAMEKNIIPPNLHYEKPRKGAKGLEEGRLQVVTEPTPWQGGYAGANSFGFGGSNAHVLLKSNPKNKINNGLPEDDLPRLAIVSGRTEEAVKVLIERIESRKLDYEFIRLLYDVHTEEIKGHLHRGYTIVSKDPNFTPVKEIQHYPGAKRPIWFVFSGMGSQWPTMGAALMKFPVFAEAIKKCDAVLKPRGVDIYNILTNPDKTTFDNILHSFVGIAAVQIGLVDLLRLVDIVPDKMIGHSVGELGCAYADGCFTAEEMVLAAYSRGLASIETEFIFGSMAAVGLGYEDLKNLCPPEIEIACHNGPGSATISGPAEAMKTFVAKLQSNGIFAREVPCSNIAYHSRYIAAAGPKLLNYLKKVIPNPKPRSEKWVSTSVPQSNWSEDIAKFSSAEYHTNNLLSPVLFEETSTLIPKDAITIEIAPHGLLQAILKRSLDPEVTNIALTQRGHKDNAEVFLQALGKLYNVGLRPQLAKLYPEIEFPVSRGTPMISPYVRWDHKDEWYATQFTLQQKIVSGERTVKINVTDESCEYLADHVIDGRNLLPATGYLSLVWETMGMMKGTLFTELPVVFEDVKFLRATNLPKDGDVELNIMIQKGTGRFEVVEGNAAVVTGVIRIPEYISQERLCVDQLPEVDDPEVMSHKDIYKEFRLRGYQYRGVFRSLQSASINATKGQISWHNNWVAFMDNMLQLQILGSDSTSLIVPTAIQKLVIDVKSHISHLHGLADNKKQFPVITYRKLKAIVSGGIEILGLKGSSIAAKRPTAEPFLEEYKFVAHRDRALTSLRDIVYLSTHLALENSNAVRVNTLELLDDEDILAPEDLTSPLFLQVLGDIPLIQANVTLLTKPGRFEEKALPDNIQQTELKKLPNDTKALIVVGHNLLTNEKSENLKQLLLALKDGGFLLSREKSVNSQTLAAFDKRALDVVLEKTTENEIFVLIKKRDRTDKTTLVVKANNNEFSWLKEVQDALKTAEEIDSSTRVIVVGENDFECGILGFVNCLRKEPGGEIVRGVLIQDNNAPAFSLSNPFYKDQLNKDLVINVLRPENQWGSYRHLPLPTVEKKPAYHAFVNQKIRGDLSSLTWFEGPIYPKFEHKDLVRIVYSSLNFRDIMLATGKLAADVVAKCRKMEECVIGFEYSGVDCQGRRLMGLTESRALTNFLIADRSLTWEIPEHWTLDEAATVPVVYSTCYSALYERGNMNKGDLVLIHAGSGGIGQAAINLALHEGCEVFTTVSTPEKRKFIRETFPSIDDDHIGNSRDISFEQMIMRKTNGRGVDIVLNSLAEEKLQASVRCLAPGGRFLEVGKFDLAANNQLGMQTFLSETSFHGIMLDNVFSAPMETKLRLKNLVTEGLVSGAVKPLIRTIFEKDQLETAFRFMATGKHIGKVLVKVRDEDISLNEPIMALPRFSCLENKSYIILGGLGGFGVELADWLVMRNATKLILTSRGGIKNGYQLRKVELWKSYGVQVEIIVGKDASDPEDCKYILQAAEKLGPVDGIFNLAVVIKDSICKNQTPETFEESFKGKARATKTLDKLSRKICRDLRHFVVFSSVSCGRGNAGQTNYGMSNSVMERICEERKKDGLPALAVQWGAIGDVGLFADMLDDNKEVVIGGTIPQKISSCLEVLDKFLQQSKTIVSSVVVAEKRAGSGSAGNIVDAVLNIMNLKDLKSVSQHSSLAELGMDSIMSVEIKQTLEREFEVFLTAQDIRGLNFAKLAELAKIQSTKQTPVAQKSEEEKITAIKMLVRNLGAEDMKPDLCSILPTKSLPGRSEVFLIPGIEGFSNIFSTLVPNLNVPAFCLQLGANSTHHNSVGDIADYLLPQVLERCKNRKFILVGYSYGSLIAIELARRLEAHGNTGKIILIDGAPEQMKLLKNQIMRTTATKNLEDSLLIGMMDIISSRTCRGLADVLNKCSNWDEKLEKFLERLPQSNDVKLSPQNQKAMCTAIYKRLFIIDDYFQSNLPPIRTQITLLKPSYETVRNLDKDYGLRKWTRGLIEVFTANGNHVTILDDSKVVAAINGDSIENSEDFIMRLMDDKPDNDIAQGTR